MGSLLPESPSKHLLRALLLEGDAARDSWSAWRERVRDPLALVRVEATDRHRALLPLIALRLEDVGFAADPMLRTVVRTALVREELRHRTSLGFCRRLAGGLAAAGLEVIWSDGPLLAEAAWPHPGARHSPRPRLIVREAELGAAAAVLAVQDFEPRRRQGGRGPVSFEHSSGFSVVLASSPSVMPSSVANDAAAFEAMLVSAVRGAWGGVEALTPAPADAFFERLLAAALGAARHSLLWVPDLVFLGRRSDFAWNRLRELQEASAVSMRWSPVLRFLGGSLELGVPEAVLAASDTAARTSRRDFEQLWREVRVSEPPGIAGLLGSAPGWLAGTRRAWWIGFPSRQFLEEAYGGDSEIDAAGGSPGGLEPAGFGSWGRAWSQWRRRLGRWLAARGQRPRSIAPGAPGAPVGAVAPNPSARPVGAACAWARHLPDKRHQRLLRACLAESAGELAERLRALDGIALDGRSVQLLPFLYRQLEDIGVGLETSSGGLLAEPAKAAYRRSWMQARIHERHLTEALDCLGGAGLDALVHKGGALARLAYPEPACRPMADVDLLVRWPDRCRAVAALEAGGWQTTETLNRDVEVKHSTILRFREGLELDLHWNLLVDHQGSASDRWFWDGSVPLAFGVIETRTLCATDHLFQTLIHGVADIEAPSFRWPLDAALLVRSHAIDWQRLAKLGSEARLSLVLDETLTFLKEALEVSLPAEALPGRRRASLFERVEFHERRSRLRLLTILWRYLRRHRDRSGVVNAIRFPAYLRRYFDAESFVGLAVLSVRKFFEHVRSALGGDESRDARSVR